MRVLFHSNQLCLRGTSVALYDYADYNESLLGNQSYIIYDANSYYNDNQAIAKFHSRFGERVYSYTDAREINQFATDIDIDFCYLTKAGYNDGILTQKPNGIHVVFQHHDPHGDIYAYISEWLSKRMTGGNAPYVPYVVHIPEPNGTIRDALGIPEDAFVFGRHGGHDQFDLRFAQEAVHEYASLNKHTYFIFANTQQFTNHPNIKFIPGFTDMQTKANFIATCNAMIHGRTMGESFGLALCEFLYSNRPALAWRGGIDQHHIDILQSTNLLYTDKEDLLAKMEVIANSPPSNYRHLVDKFSPPAVMDKFQQVFLG